MVLVVAVVLVVVVAVDLVVVLVVVAEIPCEQNEINNKEAMSDKIIIIIIHKIYIVLLF